MKIHYNWEIKGLECALDKNGLNKVVLSIHWRYIGTNENGKSFELNGEQVVDEVNPINFIDYEDLTIEIVSSWLENLIDINELKSNIERGIFLIENPKTLILNLPTNS